MADPNLDDWQTKMGFTCAVAPLFLHLTIVILAVCFEPGRVLAVTAVPPPTCVITMLHLHNAEFL